MRGVPARAVGGGPFTGFVRGEILLKRSVFEEHFRADGYKNCRNAAGGAAKDLKGERCHLLTVACYQIRPDDGACLARDDEFRALRDHGFLTAGDGWSCVGLGEVLALYNDFVDGRRAALDFDIDGLVFELACTDERESMGESGNRPEGARAFKFPHDAAETTLRDVL